MGSRRSHAGRLFQYARRRATRQGVPFSITPADIVIPSHCPVLGIPLYRATGQRAQGPNSPTLDRLDPAKGYTADNVLVVSAKANQIKSNATPRELLQVACFYQEARAGET